MAAVNALKAGGFHSDDISTFDRKRLTAGKDALTGPRHAALWQRLFGDNINQYEANVLGDTDHDTCGPSFREPFEQVMPSEAILAAREELIPQSPAYECTGLPLQRR
jgi:hypothetical protein